MDKKTISVDKKEIYYLSPGQILMRENEVGKNAYLLVSGKLKVERKAGDGTVELAEVEPMEIVGELAILGDVPRSATVTAVEYAQVVKINQHRLKTLIRRSPDIAEIMIKLLCGRLLNSTKMISQLSTQLEEFQVVPDPPQAEIQNIEEAADESTEAEKKKSTGPRLPQRMAITQRRR